jgi:hypothetical protein
MVTPSIGALLVRYANKRGVFLYVDTNGKLMCFTPTRDPQYKLRQSLRLHKASVIAYLLAEAVTAA